MARTLSAAALAKIATNLGTEPVNIIDVEWINGSFTRYTDKDKILELANIDEIIRITGSSAGASVSVVIDDSDGSVKALMDTIDIHKRPVNVYQSYEGLSDDDKFLLLKGEIISPIVWDEGERTISFEIETKVVSNQVGFSPESGQFESVNIADRVWPLCFGSVVHVPATQAQTTLQGTVASLFGFPDVSLIAKSAKLQQRLDSLLEAYEYYINQWQVFEANSPVPLTVQTNYIDVIIEEDDKKQELEDQSLILEQIHEQYTKLYNNYYSTTAKDQRDEIKQKLKDLTQQRKEYQQIVNIVREELHELSYRKKTLEIDADNARYVYDGVGRIRENIEKVVGEYNETYRDKIRVNRAIANQLLLIKDTVLIEGGEDFPQNQSINLDFGGLIINGVMVGRVFTINSVLPTYTNIEIGQNQSTDPFGNPDKFWITDSSIDLNGKYCLLSDGKIIKVTNQKGTECTFELTEIDEQEADSQEIEYDGPDGVVTETIKSELNNILRGDETPEELQIIANTIPRDISRSAWNRLAGDGNGNTYIVRFFYLDTLDEDYENKFNLSWDGLKSEDVEILKDEDIEDPTEITAKLEFALADILQVLAGDGRVLKLTNGEYITADTLRSDVFTVEYVPDEGDIEKHWLIEIKLEDYKRLTCDTDFKKKVGVDDQGKPKFDVNRGATMACFIDNENGAREHTFNKRAAMLESAISKSAYSTEIKIIREKISKIIDALNKVTANTKPDTIRAMRDVLQRHLKNFWKFVRKIDIESTIADEAFKLINDEEYRFLYELELLHYMKFKRSLEPLEAEISDNSIYYIRGEQITSIVQASPVILYSWANVANTTSMPATRAWVGNVGSRVSLAGDYQEKFVANILPSTIKGVYAYRVVDNHRLLTPVPQKYYVKNESEDYGDFNAATITLKRPLADYDSEGWEDDLYITLTSSEGPNTVDIIEYILNTYTNLTPDATTFASVKSALSNYPSHFALFEQPDALSLIDDIAYQARCAVWIKNNTMYIRYLAAEPTSIKTFTESDIEEGSLQVSYTETEELITKYTAEWRRNYLPFTPNKIVLRHNMKKYGSQPETFDYFIYNIQSLVLKSATFWLVRKSNTWKKVVFNTFLTSLQVETFDCITLNFSNTWVASSAVKALVEKVDYDSSSNSIRIEAWVPVRSGELTQYDFAWPAGISVSLEFPTPEDIISGVAGDPTNIRTPSGVTYDPYDPTKIDFRPKDYGSIKMSDIDDLEPIDPTEGIVELDHTDVSTEAHKLKKRGKITPDTDPQIGLGDDLKPSDPSAIKEAEGKRDNTVFWGRVIRFVDFDDKNPDLDDKVDVQPTQQIYEVVHPNGYIFHAKQLQMHENDRIPNGTTVLVVYEPTNNEYQMQVPIWLGTEIPEDEDA